MTDKINSAQPYGTRGIFLALAMMLVPFSLAGCGSSSAGFVPEITGLETEVPPPTFEQGQRYFAAGEIERAAGVFQRILRDEPDAANVRYGLAEAVRKLGDRDAALTEYERLVEDKAYAVRAYEGIALINLKAGQLLAASGAANKAIELGEQQAWRAWLVLARINDYAENWDAADAAYGEAFKQSDQPAIIHNNLGVSFLARRDSIAASDQFRQALALDPALESAQVNLGIAYYLSHEGQPPHVQIDPRTRARSLNNSGYIAMLRGEFDAAESMFNEAIDTYPAFYVSAEQNMAALKALQNVSDAGATIDPKTRIFREGVDGTNP